MKYEQDGVSFTENGSNAELLLSPSSWRTNINFINHLVLFNNIMTVVVAEKGGGKTSYAKIISKHLESSIQYISVKADSTFSAQKLLEMASDSFHFSLANGFDFNTLCRFINERQKHVLLAIDDAHNLSDEFVAELLKIQLAQKENAYFHILLIADYSILPVLNSLTRMDFKDKVHTIELGNLTLSETSTYVKRIASKTDYLKNIDNNAWMHQFYQQTDGAISQINATWQSFFNQTLTHKKKQKGLTKMRLAASLFVCFGAVAIFMNYSHNPAMRYPALKELITQKVIALKSESKQRVVQVDQSLQSTVPAVLIPLINENMNTVKESILASIDDLKINDLPKTSYLVSLHAEQLSANIPQNIQALKSSLVHIPSLSTHNVHAQKKPIPTPVSSPLVVKKRDVK